MPTINHLKRTISADCFGEIGVLNRIDRSCRAFLALSVDREKNRSLKPLINLLTRCRNNNRLANQHGGSKTMRGFFPNNPILSKILSQPSGFFKAFDKTLAKLNATRGSRPLNYDYFKMGGAPLKPDSAVQASNRAKHQIPAPQSAYANAERLACARSVRLGQQPAQHCNAR